MKKETTIKVAKAIGITALICTELYLCHKVHYLNQIMEIQLEINESSLYCYRELAKVVYGGK